MIPGLWRFDGYKRMKTIIRYILLTARRDWLFGGVLVLIAVLYGLASFMGSTALVEQYYMAMAYFSGSSRIVLVVGMIVFICFHMRRSFDHREIEAILSKPISRVQFLVAYWVAFTILSVGTTLPVVAVLGLLYTPDYVGLLYWSISLIAEIALVTAFTLLASLILRSAVAAVLASLAFYFVARLIGFFLAAIQQETSLMGGGILGQITEGILLVISTALPRLDMFAKSAWLIYGVAEAHDIWIFAVQSGVYIFLLMAMAIFDFKRKQF